MVKINTKSINSAAIFSLTLLIITIITISTSVQALQIYEVLYDPINSETSAEAIVLYNNENYTVNLEDYTIKTKSSVADATLPQFNLLPNQHFILADNGWQENKDSTLYPDADYTEPITLSNTDAGLSLIDPNGTLIDSVGWGNSEFTQSNPAPKTPQGMSLLRVNNTGDNVQDYIISTPFSTLQQKTSITISFTILQASLKILNITMQDDFTQQGNQIIPTPASVRLVPITILAKDYQNTTLTIEEIQLSPNPINETHANYYYNLSIPYHQEPANYTLQVESGDTQSHIEYEIMQIAAIQLDTTNLAISSEPGKTVQILGDTNMTTTNPTLQNVGNTDLEIGLIASSQLPATLIYSYTNDLTNTHTLQEDYLTPMNVNTALPISLEIRADQNAAKGSYEEIISFIIKPN